MDKVIVDAWNAATGAMPNERANGRSAGLGVKLVVDEWGAWYGKGTELAPQYNLSQQSTMRDALLTGITFDIFHRHADKVGVAAVAQSINCIHSLMLAQGDKFCVTPTYHVFRMYLPHQGAQAILPARSAATATSASFLPSERLQASAVRPRFRTTARPLISRSSTRTSPMR
jgi:alpha-N-arabinofuranosidase